MDFYYEGPSWKGITPVYNQRERPISWSVVAADCVTHLARNQDLKFGPRGDKVPPLSRQELVKWIPYKQRSYVSYQENQHGYLGHKIDAFKYIQKFGLHSAIAFPATIADDDTEMVHQSKEEINARFDYMIKHGCNATTDLLERVTIESYKTIGYDPDIAKYVAAITNQLRMQPLAAGIVATPKFCEFDGKGIYDEQLAVNVDGSYQGGFHAVMITGVGKERGGAERMFVEIKNSYGPKWADNGYAKVAPHLIFSVSYPVNASILKPQT